MSPVSSAGMIIRNANRRAPPAATPSRSPRLEPLSRVSCARARYSAVKVGTSANSPGATRLVLLKTSNSESFSKPREDELDHLPERLLDIAGVGAEEADQRRVGQRREHEADQEHDRERPDPDDPGGDDRGRLPQLPELADELGLRGRTGPGGGFRLGLLRGGRGRRGRRRGGSGSGAVRARFRFGLGLGLGLGGRFHRRGRGLRRGVRRAVRALLPPRRSGVHRNSGRSARGPPAVGRTGRRTPSRPGA